MEGKIFLKEKQIIVTTFSLLLVLGLYTLYVYKKYVQINPELINNLQFWGKAFLIMVPVMIVSLIILHIIFAIINKIVTKEDLPTITDEMDKMIDLKAVKISRGIYSIGFILAFASQAMGKQIWVLPTILIASCFVSAFIEGVVKIYFYRKGI
jgi:hypothetical protein